MKGADPREALLPVPGDDRARDAEPCRILYRDPRAGNRGLMKKGALEGPRTTLDREGRQSSCAIPEWRFGRLKLMWRRCT